MEQGTYDSIHDDFIDYNNDLPTALDLMFGENRSFEMITNNDIYAATMARLKYYQSPGVIPTTLDGQASYWKTNYNSHLGQGTTTEYTDNYHRYTPK